MLTLFRWLSRWPLWLLHAMGGALGWVSYGLSPVYRQRFKANAAQAGVSQMMRALRRGEAVGLLPDQVPPDRMGAWAPFFGKPAYTMTLAARLAQQTGAALILAWGERLPHGRGYVVHLSAFDEPLPDAQHAEAESAAVVNRAMERLIRQRPGQYLWGYDRYKTPRRLSPPDAGAKNKE